VTVLRWCRLVFWANVGLVVCLAGIVFGLHESQARIRGLLVEFRNSLMMRSASTARVFSSAPDDLLSHDFYTDSPAMIAAWRPRLRAVVPTAGVTSLRDEVDRAKAVVLSFARSGDNRPIYRMALLDKIVETQRGSGFCSDYVEIFLALSAVNGLTAREVQNDVHGFADFFSRTRSKWIFVDPQYGILATDEAGTYLSSLELRQRRLTGLPVRFVFFGTADGTIKSEEDPRFRALYGDASRFKRYVLTYGNNVLTEASRSESVAFLPWEARQLLLYASATKPHLLVLADSFADEYVRYTQWYRLVFFVISGYFVIALSCYPLLALVTRLRIRETSRIPEHARKPNPSSAA
jgi:hypothetical protein